MLDDRTKLFLIKAMTEGIECQFQNEDAKDYFVYKLQDIIEGNEKIKSRLVGDSQGLLMEDSYSSPYGVIKLEDNVVLFALLIPEPELTNEQSVDFGRIVLACLSTFAMIETEQMFSENNETYANNESTKFNISQIGIIT